MTHLSYNTPPCAELKEWWCTIVASLKPYAKIKTQWEKIKI
jgi:hypothetical protein